MKKNFQLFLLSLCITSCMYADDVGERPENSIENPDIHILEKKLERAENIEANTEEQTEKSEAPELFDVPDTEGDIYSIKTIKKEAPEKYDKSWLGKIRLKSKDINMYFGGMLRDEYFLYNRVNTLRTDFNDSNDFFRHKLSLDWSMLQGEKRYGKPATEAFVRLSNYIYWQNNNAYMPMVIDDLRSNDMNLSLAKNVSVRTLMPLIFTEQAWLKINLDAFAPTFNKNPTFIKAGLFDYIVGRGITLGYHADLAVEALGWPGEGGFTRFPYMPPGLLLRTQPIENLTIDLYFSKWREVSATIEDTTAPTRKNRLFGPRPERGKGKDRDVWVIKADYKHENEEGVWLAEPYWVRCDAPEQQIEFDADASAHLNTLGIMVDVSHKNFKINVEVAGQFGEQRVHGIDRNEIKLNSKGQPVLSHVVFGNNFETNTYPPNISRTQVPVRSIQQNSGNNPVITTDITNNIDFIVNQPINRCPIEQGQAIRDPNTQEILSIDPDTGRNNSFLGQPIYNSNAFGNKRFRCPYKLDYSGFMALADLSYEFDDLPLKLAGALGHIGGDEYPYNQEFNKKFRGFTPLRTWYKGLSVENILIFDRLVIPRPMNISYKNLYAFNNLKNISDLQYVGLGLTWFPMKDRRKLSCTSDTMFFWKAAEIPKWNKCGKHPDPAIEAQIALDRKLLGFEGWESTQKAHRMIGIETDIKVLYKLLEQCTILAKAALFFPGKLYEDLDGQPNIVTRRIDACGRSHYESLGSDTAFAFIIGFDYQF